jgi:hypothetical protein
MCCVYAAMEATCIGVHPSINLFVDSPERVYDPTVAYEMAEPPVPYIWLQFCTRDENSRRESRAVFLSPKFSLSSSCLVCTRCGPPIKHCGNASPLHHQHGRTPRRRPPGSCAPAPMSTVWRFPHQCPLYCGHRVDDRTLVAQRHLQYQWAENRRSGGNSSRAAEPPPEPRSRLSCAQDYNNISESVPACEGRCVAALTVKCF